MIETARNFSYLCWEYGLPKPNNAEALENPDLIVQTGYYSLRLGCDDMKLSGYDPASYQGGYLDVLKQDVPVFTPATLNLYVYVGGVRYTCTGGIARDDVGGHVRLIEGGRYVYRFDHIKLIFTDPGSGQQLNTTGARFEVTVWPDHVTFLLDFSQAEVAAERTTIQCISPAGKEHLADDTQNRVTLALKPHLDVKAEALNPADYIKEATDKQTGQPLNMVFDPDVHAFRIDVPTEPVSFPDDLERLDEYIIDVLNPSTADVQAIPLVFEVKDRPYAVTGTMMVLHDENDNMRPAGIPMQISKNWHVDHDHPTVHQGHWLRGVTMVTLQPQQSRRLRLRIMYGNWTGAAVASHAQLSLVGWTLTHNWQWDESALGAWGEALTYDTSQHAAGAFMADTRPTFTTSTNADNPTYDWTENVGGAQFLVYYDSSNTYRRAKKLKTAYNWEGPNLTEIFYSGVTDDDKIRFMYTVHLGRTNDYQRQFHSFQYEFLQDVLSPQRLVFYQMAADNYHTSTFEKYYVGTSSGTPTEYQATPGGNAYTGFKFELNNKFIVAEDTIAGAGHPAMVNRCLIHRKSTLNGNSFPLWVHTYGRSNGSEWMLFDLSSDDVHRSYIAGEIVEGELELALTPKNSDVYWGNDAEFRGRLDTYTAPWQAAQAECVNNVLMNVTMHEGTMLNNYPLEIRAAPPTGDDSIAANFTMTAGGIGHVPIIVRGVPKGYGVGIQRYADEAWVWLEGVHIQGHNYYQGYENADGSMDYAFNVSRPSTDLITSWRLRVNQGLTFP